MENNRLWKTTDQQLIEKYYYCYTSTTSASTRQSCFTKLYPSLLNLVKTCIKANNPKYNTEDFRQDIIIHVYQHLLPRLKQPKLQAAQQYLYLGIKNHFITKVIHEEMLKRNIPVDINYQNYSYGKDIYGYSDNHNYKYADTNQDQNIYLDSSETADKTILQEEIREKIIEEIDRKMLEQKILNKSKTIFLVLLRQYLIDNDFVESGFNKYFMEKTGYSLLQYRAIASQLNIRTTIFNVE